jgi:hypothetical protein
MRTVIAMLAALAVAVIAGAGAAAASAQLGWIDVTPYPFGFDGNPVGSNPQCEDVQSSTTNCYLSVESMAFRAWNRGVAVVYAKDSLNHPTPYGVWRYNGVRWYPDPTFPGQVSSSGSPGECPGNTILWAGKLDLWLVGSVGTLSWTTPLCRFDGVTDEWEQISVPASAVAEALQNNTAATNPILPNGITSGACFAWNDCSFFGSDGVVLHWDGQSLSAVSTGPGVGVGPWLAADYADAAEVTTAAGPRAVAVGAPSTVVRTSPDGLPDPDLLWSTGESFVPSVVSVSGSTPVAVSVNSAGAAWVADVPSGAETADQLAPISLTGAESPCPDQDLPPDAFAGDIPTGTSYQFDALGALPDGGVVAGGTNGFDPVTVQASCDTSPAITEFPAVPDGNITAIAAPADNRVWAATGISVNPDGSNGPPRLYVFTDGSAPDTPAGNDKEQRTLPPAPEPQVFVFAPPVTVVVAPPGQTIVKHRPPKRKTVKLPSPIYDVSKKPPVVPSGPGTYTLTLNFKVRSRITIGLQALRDGKVVASSGLRTFTHGSGKLVLTLRTASWPTALRFLTSKR